MAPAVFSLRSATEEDRSRLANLLHFETYVHRHLDWRRPLDWLGHSPFLIAENGGRLAAALACPQDPPGLAWIRLFAAMTRVDINAAWNTLWTQARQELAQAGAEQAAAIPLNDWFVQLLTSSGFAHIQNVVVLDWAVGQAILPSNPQLQIRPMQAEDLPAVYEVDKAAFMPLWQNPLAALQHAYQQAGFATVVEHEARIVAYQISTHSAQGLHLARLATHPGMQGRGLAAALATDLQRYAQIRKEARLSVNTQDNNMPSLALYKKLGFEFTSERFPVYQYMFGASD
ncbi:MAG: GNAT family N-acetyltransferase [Anaerolineales bacterium]|nr:MAG: GNAT family N-acetyltransferase [Anaerolineales bacterium]